jgi:hypothetical protein
MSVPAGAEGRSVVQGHLGFAQEESGRIGDLQTGAVEPREVGALGLSVPDGGDLSGDDVAKEPPVPVRYPTRACSHLRPLRYAAVDATIPSEVALGTAKSGRARHRAASS